jgi:hypothetical protein
VQHSDPAVSFWPPVLPHSASCQQLLFKWINCNSKHWNITNTFKQAHELSVHTDHSLKALWFGISAEIFHGFTQHH